MDLGKYLHKMHDYVGIIYTPVPFFTVTLLVFDPNGVLVQKNQIKWLLQRPCDPYTDEYCTDDRDPFLDFKAAVEAVADNYMTIYEEADAARLKEELIRMKGAKEPKEPKEPKKPGK